MLVSHEDALECSLKSQLGVQIIAYPNYLMEVHMRIVLGIVVGLFVAWNVKQPAIMKELQEWGLYKFDEYVDQLCQKYKKPEVTKEN